MWVFAYGSLIWNPEFPVAEARLARVSGWQRSFCMRSIHHRGTESDPGLVLALDEQAGAYCDGLALRVAEGQEQATLAALRERELISSAYREVWLPAVAGGDALTVLCYVIDRDHAQYCGGLGAEEQAHIIARAVGGRGANRDYLWATVEKLNELGIADPALDALAARVREIHGH